MWVQRLKLGQPSYNHEAKDKRILQTRSWHWWSAQQAPVATDLHSPLYLRINRHLLSHLFISFPLLTAESILLGWRWEISSKSSFHSSCAKWCQEAEHTVRGYNTASGEWKSGEQSARRGDKKEASIPGRGRSFCKSPQGGRALVAEDRKACKMTSNRGSRKERQGLSCSPRQEEHSSHFIPRASSPNSTPVLPPCSNVPAYLFHPS